MAFVLSGAAPGSIVSGVIGRHRPPKAAFWFDAFWFELSGMLTRKGKYGLKALVHLSRMPAGRLAFVGDIAVANNIPKKFLDAILGELRNAGFVESRKGKDGGYRLARPASEIAIGQVVRVLDGPLAPVPCASQTRYRRCEDCDEATCEVRRMMLEVRHAIAEVLDGRSLAAMRDAGGLGLPAHLEADPIADAADDPSAEAGADLQV